MSRMYTLFKLLFLLFVVSLITSCKTTKNKNFVDNPVDIKDTTLLSSQKKNISNSFVDNISSLDILNLPYTFFCGAKSYTWTSEYGKGFEAILPEAVIGRLPAKNNREYIICGVVGDIIYPYLYVYDEKGNRLDSLYLHIGFCLGDEDIITSNTTTINIDYSINMIDTTKYISYDQEDVIIDSIYITKKKIIEEPIGVFKVLEEKKYRIE